MSSAFGKLNDLMESQGEVFVACIFSLLLVATLVIGTFIINKMHLKNPKFLLSLKDKLMWGVILRPIHQGYFR